MRSDDPRRRGPDGVPRLAFLDGVRGLAALYVALHHAALMVPPFGLGLPASAARFFFRHGHYAVTAFIVLSGYGLMHRALAGPGGGLLGGWLAYLGRRARRLLPPYYAALALCWLLIAAVPALGRMGGTPWDRALPAWGPGVVASHLLLVHNLAGGWMYRVAPAFWSLATAWQLGLIFPGLLRLHHKRGPAAVVAAGFALGAAVEGLAIPLHNPALRALCPWYAGLFALGMEGAALVHRRRDGHSLDARRVLAGAVVPALALLVSARAGDGYLAATDVLAGAAIVGLVVRLAEAEAKGGRSPGLRLATSPAARWLGDHSYSLYLTHYPLLALANLGMIGAGWGPDARLAMLGLAAVPVCLAASVPFRRVFDAGPAPARRAERPAWSRPRGEARKPGSMATRT